MLKSQKMIFWVVAFILWDVPIFAESVDTAWVRRYNGPGNDSDEPCAITVDDSGNVCVTGASGGDYATIKYHPNGDTAWVRRYDGSANSFDWASTIAVDGSGNVYVTGFSPGIQTSNDYVTIKYYPNGDTAWVRRYDGAGGLPDVATDLAVDDSGNVCVTGTSGGDYATIKYYPNGDTAWVRRCNIGWDEARAIAVDGSGNVYVTGSSWDSVTYDDYVTIKYYPNGDTAWVRRYDGPVSGSDDEANAIAVDDFGNAYVTGYSYGYYSGTYDHYVTIKYYSNGDTAWVRRYSRALNPFGYAPAIVVDGSGNVYVTGGSYNLTSLDYTTIKYYPNGDTAWVRRYNGPGNSHDCASALALDASNNVYVTGHSVGIGTGADYATVKYNPNGDTAWARRYDGPTSVSDFAWAIAVDGAGNVYVTGGSVGIGTGGDYCTIKYVQGISHVSIIDYAFVPQTDTIAVGDSVRWTNNGAVPHTTTSDTKSLWDSGTLNPGESFTFQFESDGVYPYHCEFQPSMAGTIVVEPPSAVGDETGDRERPSEFALSQNYPNPFNPTTNIEFTLSKSGFVTLQIYDVLGRKVRTLVSEDLSSGYKSVLWDGKNNDGKDVASGAYFYQLKVGDFSEPKKMLLLK